MYRPWGLPAALVMSALLTPVGCREDARLADAKLRDPVVADVTLAGLTLDQEATPEMVTFALLKAIQEDIDAGRDLEAREAAFDKQFQLAAPATIHEHQKWAVGREHADLKESVYRAVRTWAPTLGHYAGSFDFTFEQAQARMHTEQVPLTSSLNRWRKGGETHVLLEAPDPDGDPNASVVIRVRLLREQERWRVWWVGFERSLRHLRTGACTFADQHCEPDRTRPDCVASGGRYQGDDTACEP